MDAVVAAKTWAWSPSSKALRDLTGGMAERVHWNDPITVSRNAYNHLCFLFLIDTAHTGSNGSMDENLEGSFMSHERGRATQAAEQDAEILLGAASPLPKMIPDAWNRAAGWAGLSPATLCFCHGES